MNHMLLAHDYHNYRCEAHCSKIQPAQDTCPPMYWRWPNLEAHWGWAMAELIMWFSSVSLSVSHMFFKVVSPVVVWSYYEVEKFGKCNEWEGDNILSGLDLGSGAHMLQMVPAACLLPRCQQHACYVGASSIWLSLGMPCLLDLTEHGYGYGLTVPEYLF